MGLDIRVPLGLIFLAIGAILVVFGAATHGDTALYARSLDIDLNFVWGAIMVVFGAVMFFIGRRQKWQDDPGTPRPWERESEGRPRH